MIDARQEVAKIVRIAIRRSGLAKAEVCRRAGITRMTLWNMLNCTRKNCCRFDMVALVTHCCGFRLVLRTLPKEES